MHRLCCHSQTGTSLVEVLLAMVILVSLALPITKFRAYILSGGPSGKELAQIIAVSRLEDLGDQFRSGIWSSSGDDYYEALGHLFHRNWALSDVGSDTGMGTGRVLLRRARVTVSCEDCFGGNPEVEVVGLVGKVP